MLLDVLQLQPDLTAESGIKAKVIPERWVKYGESKKSVRMKKYR